MSNLLLVSAADLVSKRISELLEKHEPGRTPAQEFWGAQFDLGLAWVQFPEGEGGLGLAPGLQRVVDDELRQANAPSNFKFNAIGVGMAGPVLQAFACPEVRQRLLRPLFTCEEVWCQLFSEPGAGSDVASLASRAVHDGEEWVVNGQKVWTTLAHRSRWGLLAARTDPDQPKHKGMTFFVVDMHTAGVDVRPLRQMTGDAEFNEVYFTDVHIPDSMRLGEVGDGWRVTLATLMNERSTVGSAGIRPQGGGVIGQAIELWRACENRDPVLRDRLVACWIQAEVLRLTNLRAQARRAIGTPGPEESITKLMATELTKRLTNLCVDLLGPAGMLYDSYEMTRPESLHIGAGADPTRAFLRSRANSIEGGTSEIMRNILAERVLGLPADVRVDKELPWSQVPRSA